MDKSEKVSKPPRVLPSLKKETSPAKKEKLPASPKKTPTKKNGPRGDASDKIKCPCCGYYVTLDQLKTINKPDVVLKEWLQNTREFKQIKQKKAAGGEPAKLIQSEAKVNKTIPKVPKLKKLTKISKH